MIYLNCKDLGRNFTNANLQNTEMGHMQNTRKIIQKGGDKEEHENIFNSRFHTETKRKRVT